MQFKEIRLALVWSNVQGSLHTENGVTISQ